jgi:Lysozyme like domain
MAAAPNASGAYSYAQLEALWIQAGGSKALAPLMAAIAEAESSGNPTAENPSGATGLWQILGAVNPADQPNLTDPTVNAKEAVLKYRSQGLGAWVTYTSGAYEAFLSNSTPPDYSGVPAGSTAGTVSATTDAADAAAAAGGTPCLVTMPSVGPIGGGCIFTKSEARAMIGGLVLTAGALIMLPGLIILAAGGFRSSGAASAVAGAAAPLGRVPGYGSVLARAR